MCVCVCVLSARCVFLSVGVCGVSGVCDDIVVDEDVLQDEVGEDVRQASLDCNDGIYRRGYPQILYYKH